MTHNADTDQETECPICSKPTHKQVCHHHLACFDLTFADQGQFGMGLSGGEIYDIEQIGKLFDAIQEDCAAAMKFAATDTPVNPVWLSGRAQFEAYAVSLLEVDLDPTSYDDVRDLAHDLAVEAESLPELRREIVEGLLSECDVDFTTTHQVLDEVPGQSSEYESWWCEAPKSAARALAKVLEAVLSRREGTQIGLRNPGPAE